MILREPVVAGQFYPADKTSLIQMIKRNMPVEKVLAEDKMKAAIVPHAGYIYSGQVAGNVYSLVPRETEVAIILGPNHTGLGGNYSIIKEGSWQTPLGKVEIAGDIAGQIFEKAEVIENDAEAHRMEHSIEVQVPFLQCVNPKIKIVPIVLASHNLKELKKIADAIASVVKNSSQKIMVFASSDMTHYEPQDEAKEKDKKAIDSILALDDERLMENVKKYSITMCGAICCYVALNFAKQIGAKGGKLIRYQTSGDVSGDYSSVVGYAGIVLI